MRLNTRDTAIFTWQDPRYDDTRIFDTSLYPGKIVIEDIVSVDDWTISREWITQPTTAITKQATHAWEQIVFDIKGKIVDSTKQTDEDFRHFFRTNQIIHMEVVGHENLVRDFCVSGFQFARYGNVREFSVSCVDVNGQIENAQYFKYDFISTSKNFTFPFSNPIGSTFVIGTQTFASSIEIDGNSFLETEPFIFECAFAQSAASFTIQNDKGKSFTILYGFQVDDKLTIDMIDSIFTLMRGNVPVSILPYIDYANSKLFGIEQGNQAITFSNIALDYATISYMEHYEK